ncbi:MAG: isochorismatase family cysteine hydrolase [Pleurocapsa sp. MO_226.B13]|nr:isochorismatase family cysteine hydrolase [Pleurocapsa sp. MO_226.B13]
MVLIPAQPYDYEIPGLENVALLIIDMQRDFLEPGGFGEALGNDISQLQQIVPTLKRILDLFRDRGLTIIYTVEGHLPDLCDCPPSKLRRGNNQLKIGDLDSMGRILILGEPGNEIIAELQPLANEILIPKPGKGAFYRTDLESWLQQKQITHLIMTGVTTEVCVQTTMREANDRGYECLLVEDATASYFPEFKQSTLEMIRAQGGIVGWTTSSKLLLRALSGDRSIEDNPADLSLAE